MPVTPATMCDRDHEMTGFFPRAGVVRTFQAVWPRFGFPARGQRRQRALLRSRRCAALQWHQAACVGAQATQHQAPSGARPSGSEESSRLSRSRGMHLILPEAQAPQPDHDVHDGAPTIHGGAHHLPGAENVFRMGLGFSGLRKPL